MPDIRPARGTHVRRYAATISTPQHPDPSKQLDQEAIPEFSVLRSSLGCFQRKLVYLTSKRIAALRERRYVSLMILELMRRHVPIVLPVVERVVSRLMWKMLGRTFRCGSDVAA
jgi:hypothetical protein